MNDINTIFFILLPLFAGIAAYWTIIRKLKKESNNLIGFYKKYNTMLQLSVWTFIASSLSYSMLQTCRVDLIQECHGNFTLDLISLFVSISLFAAFLVMYLLVNTKAPIQDDSVKDIRQSLKTIGEQTKRAEIRSMEIDANTAGKRGNVMRGRGKKGKGKQ